MELYLDSADIREIESAFRLPFLNGLTTTPTFMHRHGVTDIDGLVVKLSKMVPVLQIEALGNTAEEILQEARRQLALGLNPEKTVFKIPVSLEGVRACALLRSEGLLVNVHLIYTLQQAYMAMKAGATYVCPLVGRLQDQGHDALELVKQCVSAVDHYGYPTRVMFSSVRHPEHVRNALNLGAHCITIPWIVLKQLTENHFTTLGTQEFFEHTRLMTKRVRDVIRPVVPAVPAGMPLADAVVKMTEYGFGSVVVVDGNREVIGVFTDGDLRRKLQEEGRDVLNHTMAEFQYKKPISVAAGALLHEAADLFRQTKVDTLLVMENNQPAGMLDIQDMELE